MGNSLYCHPEFKANHADYHNKRFTQDFRYYRKESGHLEKESEQAILGDIGTQYSVHTGDGGRYGPG